MSLKIPPDSTTHQEDSQDSAESYLQGYNFLEQKDASQNQQMEEVQGEV